MGAVPADESPRATCVFCQIVDGGEPASVVYFDAGHRLHRPAPDQCRPPAGSATAHAARLADLDVRLGAAMFAVGQRLAGAIRLSGLPCEESTSSSPTARSPAEVMHVHLHVLPRTPATFRIERGSAITGRPSWTRQLPLSERPGPADLLVQAVRRQRIPISSASKQCGAVPRPVLPSLEAYRSPQPAHMPR